LITKPKLAEWLDDSGELLWMSERDGWAHLWLYMSPPAQ